MFNLKCIFILKVMSFCKENLLCCFAFNCHPNYFYSIQQEKNISIGFCQILKNCENHK